MEEKKLTDEEIVKELECCISGSCKDCSYRTGKSTCKMKKLIKDTIGLIGALKTENEGLKERGENVINMLHETIADQKEEIERLTKRHERIDLSKKEYLDWVREFLNTHTDEEDCQMFNVDYVCGVFGAKIEGTIEYIIDLENKRNELQKQVDELKERYLEESKERCKFEQLYGKIRHEHNIGLGVQRKHWEKKVQQAVKDTAKEILQEIFYEKFQAECDISSGCTKEDVENIGTAILTQTHNKIKEMAKRYGVEVE